MNIKSKPTLEVENPLVEYSDEFWENEKPHKYMTLQPYHAFNEGVKADRKAVVKWLEEHNQTNYICTRNDGLHLNPQDWAELKGESQ